MQKKINSIIQIRDADAKDADNLLKITKAILEKSKYLVTLPAELCLTKNEEMDWINSFKNERNSRLLLAVVNDEIVGSLSFKNHQKERLKHSGEMSISLIPTFCNKGIGSKLLEFFFDWIINTQISRVYLEVVENNTIAIKLYKKFGFEVEGILRNAVMIDGKYHNNLIMGKLIEEHPT
jgi:RimJ/RimL family protein N-acetyltransferase